MIKSIISQMKRYADESDKELKEDLTVQALGIDSEERLKLKVDHFPGTICKARVLLDGGASHNVYYSPDVPDGAVKKEVELAHGTKIGYVKGADITFVDKSRTLKESKRPTVISPGLFFCVGPNTAHLGLETDRGANA